MQDQPTLVSFLTAVNLAKPCVSEYVIAEFAKYWREMEDDNHDRGILDLSYARERVSDYYNDDTASRFAGVK